MASIGEDRLASLVDHAEAAGSVRDVFASVSEHLRRLVHHDAAVWLAVDPAYQLPTAPTRSENMGFVGGSEGCLRLWELEFLVADVNPYREVARAPLPARGLRAATEDRPARSARYREFLRPNGLGDELRAALRVDGETWAWLALYREHGRPGFDVSDAELVARLSEPLGGTIRDHARPLAGPAIETGRRGPGLMLFAPTGELTSMNDDALAWLDELPPDFGKCEPRRVRFPIAVAAALMRARSIAEERDHGSARARVRSRAGRWLVCHASCLREPDGELGHTALTIEPATGSEIAPIIVQAYELSPREQQITELIARGQTTAAIATRLHLSIHTVRDYVKAIFDKVDVSSRGQLVAKLFAEHYTPVHTAPGGLEQVAA